MTTYTKSTPCFFDDLCDQRKYGITLGGSKFDVLTPNIISNKMKWTDSLIGVTNPAWKAQIRQGLSATTAMTATRKSVVAKKCLIEVRTSSTLGVPGNFGCTEWKGYPLYGMPDLDPPTLALMADVRNAALAKFFSHVAEARNNSQYGETLGEWKETVRAVTNPLGALRDFIIRWRRTSKKRLRRFKRRGRTTARADRRFRTNQRQSEALAKAVAGTYLEFVFGWIPLVKSTNEAVQRMLDRWDYPERKVVKGKGWADYNGVNTEGSLFTHDMVRVTQGVKTHSRIEHRFKASIKTGAVGGKISLAQTLGLLPSDFVPTIYELFPFSFVLDYFLQVGDLINAMSFRRDWIVWGIETRRIFTERIYSVPITRVDPSLGPFPSTRLEFMNAWGGDATLRSDSVMRQDITQVSLLPDLYWHMPFNWKAWVNLSALFTSNFARGI
jgi:hypothetical protein